MEIVYDYYPADNGAIISMPEQGTLDVVQAAKDNRKFVGAKYFGKNIIADIELVTDQAPRDEGVLLGVKVTVNYEPIYRKEKKK